MRFPRHRPPANSGTEGDEPENPVERRNIGNAIRPAPELFDAKSYRTLERLEVEGALIS